MARADRRRVQRPKSATRPARTPQAEQRARRKRGKREPTLEDTLFFNRLRNHAKWVFVFLALIFASTFVVFGVGSGGSGLGDLLFLDGGGGTSDVPSLSDAREKALENPRSAAAQYDLAQAAQQEGETDEAITALEAYSRLRPSDREKLEELAGLYLAKAQQLQVEAQAANASSQVATANPAFQVTLTAPPKKKGESAQTVPLGNEGATSVESSISSVAQTKFNEKYQELTTAFGSAESTYQKIVTLAPKDPTAQIQLAQTAQQAGDLQTAVKAYDRFLKLAPDDPSADIVKEQLKQLRAQLAPAQQGSSG